MLLAMALATLLFAGPSRAEAPLDVELFTRSGCPHCEAAHAFVQDLALRRPSLAVKVTSVDRDASALARLRVLVERAGRTAVSVPAFDVRGTLVVGFDRPETTGRRVEALLDGAAAAGADVQSDLTCGAETDAACDDESVDVPLFGRVDPGRLGLPLFTAAMGLVDGFNPCAMWVLLLLLSLLVNLHDRGRMALVASVFVVVSGLAYFAFMAAWLNVFLLVGVSRLVQIALGCLALVAGAVHVKDFFAYGKGPSLSIPASAKPGIYARIRAIVRAENALAALAGAVVLAVLVNGVELLCTAGLPALYTEVLARRALTPLQRYAYLGLYNVFYMLDDAVMVTLAVVTLGRRKLQETSGRWLKLVSGVVVLALGAMLLFRPELLT